jgi:hypothetical protein
MEESLKYGEDAVVADLDAAEILQPGVGGLDFPALSVASQLAFVLEAAVADVLPVGNDQLRTLPFQSPAQWIGVIAPVGYDAPQVGTRASASLPGHAHLLEGALREPAFGNLRGPKLHSDRYAPAVDHHHALRTFPATGFPDCRAPFFAVMNVASRKASSQSNNRRWSNRESSFRQAASQMPRSSHIRNRRQQVEPSGYSSGRPATGLLFAAPTRSPPRTNGSKPRGGHVHPCVASVPETADIITPTALRSTTLAASSASWKKLNIQLASPVSPSLEAEPIYATSSSPHLPARPATTLRLPRQRLRSNRLMDSSRKTHFRKLRGRGTG